jgi:DNA-binding XRE family transcriptional regulator
MKLKTRKELEKHGWKIGTVSELLGLTKEDERIIEMRLELAELLATTRKKKRMTQAEVAAMLETSQSRIAFAEAGKPDVSFELLIRSLLKIGATPRSIGRAIEKVA